MEKHIKQARSDDSGNVKTNILRFITPKPEYPSLRSDLPKVDRGFYHLVIGRLLCPVALLDHFDRGPQQFALSLFPRTHNLLIRFSFCDEALAGRVKITADDLPTFVYPDDAYNDQAPDELLLQSPLISSVSLSLLSSHHAHEMVAITVLPFGHHGASQRPC